MENTITALIPAPNRNILSYQESKDFALVAATSRMFLNKNITSTEKALAVIMTGRELGLGPATSLRSIHNIDGVLTLSSRLMTALVKNSGDYDIKTLEWSNQAAEIQFVRRVGAPSKNKPQGVWVELTPTSRFTLEDAKQAKYIKAGSAWEKTPKNMLWARALTNGFIIHCPQLGCGMQLYAVAEEELEDLSKPVECSQKPVDIKVVSPPAEAEYEPCKPPLAPTERVTIDQLQKLRNLADDKGSSLVAIQKFHNLDALSDMTQQVYESVMKVLRAK